LLLELLAQRLELLELSHFHGAILARELGRKCIGRERPRDADADRDLRLLDDLAVVERAPARDEVVDARDEALGVVALDALGESERPESGAEIVEARDRPRERARAGREVAGSWAELVAPGSVRRRTLVWESAEEMERHLLALADVLECGSEMLGVK